ncbi:MAG TPA: hypothetical protein VH394_17810 [Thermoanaerobaculia bacterium]|jgi:hypothetical protein|nr:hypothetical protein [Thermoanaerobaculia bacterium]
MAFKFKDLMINVTSGGGGGDTPICTYDTVDPKPAGAAARGITCTYDTMDPAGQAKTCTYDTVTGQAAPDMVGIRGRYTGICTYDTVRPDAFAATVTTVTTVTTLLAAVGGGGSASLAQLKSQLQQALADVEQRERAQEAAGLPQTVEEADDLERRMEGALQELREHRKSLEKGARKGASKASKPKK